MNITEALNNSFSLLSNVSKTYKLDAEVLLAHVLNKKNRLDIYLDLNQELNIKEKKKFEDLVKQRVTKKPVSKIINQKSFWNFDFDISKKVLIPRPETEVLIEMVTKKFNVNKDIKFLDIGCGSGCISISLLDYFKKSNGAAIDISKDAVLNTQLNLNNFNLTNRLKVLKKNVFSYRTGKKFD